MICFGDLDLNLDFNLMNFDLNLDLMFILNLDFRNLSRRVGEGGVLLPKQTGTLREASGKNVRHHYVFFVSAWGRRWRSPANPSGGVSPGPRGGAPPGRSSMPRGGSPPGRRGGTSRAHWRGFAQISPSEPLFHPMLP